MMDRFKKIFADPRVLFVATAVILTLPNLGLSLTEPMSWPSRLTNVLLPVSLYLLLLTLVRNPARGVWLSFFLIFLSAFQMVLLYLFGDSIIAVDMFMNLVTTNCSEVTELLGSLLPAMIAVVVVYIPILIIAAVRARHDEYRVSKSFVRRVRRYALCLALLGGVSLGVCYASDDEDYRASDQLYPFNVCYNIGLAVERSHLTSERGDNVAHFSFHAVPTHHADSLREVYVLVIGETARAENFGIYGYGRNTTPRLSTIPGIVKCKEAYTQSNTTHKSVPMLLTACSAEDFDHRIYSEKGLISAFREAGFHTTFVSNQRPNHSFIDFLGEEADEWRFLKEEGTGKRNVLDGELVGVVDSILTHSVGNQLIVLHTYGSHFSYTERYPRSMAKWLPDVPTDATASNRQTLVNAYDNSIRYTDHVLGALIDRLAVDGGPAALVYASDHGENIFDDERGLFLHASPRPSAHELHVPMIAWMSPQYCDCYPNECSAIKANCCKRVITSASVFHTMLGLGGISTPQRVDTLSLASATFKEIPYLYLSDRNIPVPVEKIMR